MTKGKLTAIALGGLIAWYAFILILPSIGHPQPALVAMVHSNLIHLANSGLDTDSVRAAIQNYKRKGLYNAYEFQLEPDGIYSWVIIARPKKKSVGPPIWRQIFLLDFYQYEYPTLRIRPGDIRAETI